MSIEDPHDVLNTVNLVTQCLCIPIVTIFVAMRFAIRAWYKQWAPVEDWTCFTAWLLFMAYCGIGIMIGKYGGGYHYTDVSEEHLVLFRKFCYIATVLYCPMALLVKIALLSILIRIFSPYKNKILFIYIFLGALCVYYIIAEIVKIRMCDPVPAYWTQDDPNASCLDQQAALIADSVISVVSDLLILLLPLPLTWSLQMSRNKKLRVIGMLSAGGLATAFSIYRLILVLRDGSSPDMTIVFICVILSGNAEGGVGLICACLPSLNIVIAKLRNHSYKSRYYKHQGSSVALSRVRGNTNTGVSSKSRNEAESHEINSDQSHLISFAGAVERNHKGAHGGIHKTVDVSQTVEMVDESESDLRRSNL
ncbi:integral membrane protein [Aspergillus granulosus]|uniref:Integral membrane protein n=1 Tax=Aspergillus granulosus TaxID=176169 RepID=A0ABR4HEN7_9EURO